MQAVRPGPSPAVLLPGLTAGISEVSRFSCMKFLGVSGVYDYAGPSKDSRYRPNPYCLPQFGAQYPAHLSPVYASQYTSRCNTQNSGPSGSLLLPLRTPSFPTSCRFIPAHCDALFSSSVVVCDPWKFFGCYTVPSPMTLAFDRWEGSRHFRKSPPSASRGPGSSPSRRGLLRPSFRRIGDPLRRRISLQGQLGKFHRRDFTR
jgi:hypothetical protein